MRPTTEGFDRTQHHYKQLKRDFRKDCEHHGLGCWLCPQPIDYTLKWPHPESFTVDHAKPVSKFPELADDPLNFRPAHLVCNQMRGTTTPTSTSVRLLKTGRQPGGQETQHSLRGWLRQAPVAWPHHPARGGGHLPTLPARPARRDTTEAPRYTPLQHLRHDGAQPGPDVRPAQGDASSGVPMVRQPVHRPTGHQVLQRRVPTVRPPPR